MLIRKISQATSWLSLTQIVTMGLGFITSILLARYISQETFGQYQLLVSILGGLGIFSLSGIPTVIRIEKKSDDILLQTGYSLTLIIAIAIFIFLLLGSSFSILISLILGLSFFLTHASQITKAKFHQQDKFKHESLISSFLTLASLLLLLLILFTNNRSPLHLFAVLVLPSISLWSLIGLYKNRELTFSIRLDKNVKYAVWLSLVNLLPVLAANIDSLLIGYFISYQDLAIYTFALSIPLIIQGLLKNISLSTQSYISTKTKQAEVWSLLKTTTLLVMGSILIYFLVSPFIFEIFYPRYFESIALTKIAILILLGIPGHILLTILQTLRQKKLFLILTLTTSLFSIISIIIGHYLSGVTGVIWGRVISRITMTLVTLVCFHRLIKQSDIFPQ